MALTRHRSSSSGMFTMCRLQVNNRSCSKVSIADYFCHQYRIYYKILQKLVVMVIHTVFYKFPAILRKYSFEVVILTSNCAADLE